MPTLPDELSHLDADVARDLFFEAASHAFNSIMVTTAEETGNGPIIFVNDAFTEMTGYTEEEVLGETPGLMQGPKTDQDELDRLAQDLQDGKVFQGETVNYKKDGSAFRIEWKVAPVENAEGEVTHYVAIQRDVTARREAEAA
ncbi:MAG: PAS sensor domain-containing protein [Bacteroidetes bacterium QS_8_68_28]|jgi:PAS domain S-box-containing protein|nr:MAG: PAS sensor domain-containing protein [Bacteroidetes bacterium QS_8_68_28]